MVLRLRGGGKVHGSLARAGKVKGQTPKVEKQEKRKTPRGRAKKRQVSIMDMDIAACIYAWHVLTERPSLCAVSSIYLPTQLYNRRFVNVMTGIGGKKLGPNSNADKAK